MIIQKAGLDPDDHFIRLKTVADEGQFCESHHIPTLHVLLLYFIHCTVCESPHHDELLGNLVSECTYTLLNLMSDF